MSDRVQSKSKAMDTSIFHSGLIRMLVSEELGKKDISWEHFVIASHFKFDIVATPHSQIEIPLPSTGVVKQCTSKKRNGRVHVNFSKLIKNVP